MKGRIAVFGLVLALCLGGILWLSLREAPEDEGRGRYILSCAAPVYKAIQHAPEKHVGERIAVTGRVLEAKNRVTAVFLFLDTPEGTWFVTVPYPRLDRPLRAEELLIVYGECRGVYLYAPYDDPGIALPWVEAVYLTHRE